MKPPWLEIAEQELGTAEVPGTENNPRILEYAATTSLAAQDDETAWCSAFVNWCLKQANIDGTNSAAARSWGTWGSPLATPALGAIIVLSRPPNPAQGHVAFCTGLIGTDRLALLGGNQGNRVSVATFPRSRVVAMRWPTQVAAPVGPCPPYAGTDTGESTTA